VSAEVIPIRKQTAADEAWSSYAAMVREMVENPALMHDREHVEQMLLAFNRFRQVFLGGAI
jgi:hypothetical protein